EDVRDADLGPLLRLQRQRAGGIDRLVRVRDLLVQARRLRVLRPDQDKVAAEPGDQETGHGQHDQDGLRDVGLHEPPPGLRTSEGSTCENSRKTRSQTTRCERAALSALTRVCLSAASAFCVCTFDASGVGIAASSACNAESCPWRSLTLPLAERKSTDSMALSSTAPITGTTTTHCACWCFWR